MTSFLKRFGAIWRALPFSGASKSLVTVIDLSGVIGDAGGPGRKGLSLKKLEKTLEAAFKPDNLSAVALAVNSPGGSPVQSRLIMNAIRRHATEKEVPVLAFVEDVGASGGYILALAGDEIYVDESSIVGSIGVISGGFGFHEAIRRIGVERRVYTAGENKSMLDPFQPEDPKDIERLEVILTDLHEQFKALVKERRGDKLADDSEMFSGAIWTGPAAAERGLVDGIAQLGDFLRERFGDDVKIKRIAVEGGSLLKKLLAGGEEASGLNASASLLDADELIAAGERRALWARYGL
ncbi:S49 family peptidase [Hyphococcus flavus]|uniref:S49 family peptidase n=1 Tax=Hyphococcus flavus TaxID=1866326 RepID=A0AAE9ZG73_9PROT|nr:S49 family peptidase [Hyphococcus flavus]WDI33245.1 S49 family peptidase [Hyphococcus flavus]